MGYDLDPGALEQCRANLEEMDIHNVELIQADVTKRLPHDHGPVHTVIMNPPFGTKHNKGQGCAMASWPVDLTPAMRMICLLTAMN